MKRKNKKQSYKFNVIDQFLVLFAILLGSLIVTKSNENSDFSINGLKQNLEEHINILSIRNVLLGQLDIFFKQENASEVSHDLSAYETVKEIKDGLEVHSSSQEIVVNICDGIVVRKTKSELVIKGLDGYEYHYGNLGSVNVNLYDYVKVNDILAISLFSDIEDKYIYTLKIKTKGGFLNVKDVLGIA